MVKVTVQLLGLPISINKEIPEGIFDEGTSKVLKAVAPTILCGQVNKHEAVVKATRAGAIAIATVGTYSMENCFGMVNGATMGASFDCKTISKCGRRSGVCGDVKASAKVLKQVVVQFATAKHLFECQNQVTDNGRGGGLQDIMRWNDGFVKA